MPHFTATKMAAAANPDPALITYAGERWGGAARNSDASGSELPLTLTPTLSLRARDALASALTAVTAETQATDACLLQAGGAKSTHPPCAPARCHPARTQHSECRHPPAPRRRKNNGRRAALFGAPAPATP